MFNETLNRGHQSEITDIKRRGGYRAYNASGRRTFTFKGSQSKRPAESKGRSRVRHTPASSKNASFLKTVSSESAHVNYARSASQARRKARTPATSRSRSRSTVRTKQRAPSPKAPSRAASVAGSQPPSRKASIAAIVDIPPAEGTPMDFKELPVVQEPPTPEVIKIEESKLVSSPKSSDSESHDEDEDTENEADDSVSSSPSVVAYRKLVFNEEQNKWIEHLKVEEDLKKLRQQKKREAVVAKIPPPVTNVHKVKGRSTAKMQVMFPTAIIKQDRRRGFNHITMTDPLRIELHKRKAPIVPTYFQEHILKYGKLPFRNNPRPHPIV